MYGTRVASRQPGAFRLGELDGRADDDDEPDRGEGADQEPGGIEFPAPHADLRRGRVGVVVVVEPLAARQPREASPVERRVLEVPGAAPVAEHVDQRSQDQNVEDRVHAGRDEPGEGPEQETQQRGAHAEAGTPREKTSRSSRPSLIDGAYVTCSYGLCSH